ncbi:Hypothetical predicted protein, partial [Marmota monax]
TQGRGTQRRRRRPRCRVRRRRRRGKVPVRARGEPPSFGRLGCEHPAPTAVNASAPPPPLP